MNQSSTFPGNTGVPLTPPAPKPCPSCGHCPTCGRRKQYPNYYPWHPWYGNINTAAGGVASYGTYTVIN